MGVGALLAAPSVTASSLVLTLSFPKERVDEGRGRVRFRKEFATMNTDCMFWIGSAHPVCQDYAVAGGGLVVLCDGCSSSPETDIGARLLARSAFQGKAVQTAAECAALLGLPETCLDATLLTIHAENGAFMIRCTGDGVIAFGRQDGSIDMFVIAYAASYPLYPSYSLDDTRLAQWTAQANNIKTVQHWTLTAADEVVEGGTRESDSAAEQFSGTADDTRFAAVLSDGVHSFTQTVQTETSRTTVAVPAAAVLAELLAFKNSRGQFVQRRGVAFRKECEKRGWRHSDDVSLGVVWLGE